MTVIHDENKAILVTWTCYGTWLPGDERGFVSNKLRGDGSFDRKRNAPGTEPHADDPYTHSVASELQEWPTVMLTPAQALAAANSLCELARKRKWIIHRAAIMANHVHVVVANCPDDGPAARRVLKGVTSADLSRAEGKSLRWWTAGGSNRYLKGTEAIEAGIQYVAEQEYKLAEVINNVAYSCFDEKTGRRG
jgi:REP element-mobilizing transposase RayT